MTDPETPAPKNGTPDGVPPPPKPNILDPSKSGPTYQNPEKSRMKKRKKQGRSHPTDAYPTREKKGCKGCCGCLGGSLLLIVLLFVGLSLVVGYYGPGRFIAKEGYKVVALDEEEVATVGEAPTEPTFYVGTNIIYNAPQTTVPIAILGTEITITGDFLEDVSLTAIKVTAGPDARFDEDLEIYAAEFRDKGVELKGELGGRVMKSLE